MTHLMLLLGLETHWEIITGTPDFFECANKFLKSPPLGIGSIDYG